MTVRIKDGASHRRGHYAPSARKTARKPPMQGKLLAAAFFPRRPPPAPATPAGFSSPVRNAGTASAVACRASSRRPRLLSMRPGCQALRQIGRKASGRCAASRRRISTASAVACRASSRRPSVAEMTAHVDQALRQIGQEGVGTLRGQPTADLDRLGGRLQGLLPTAQV
jgi:hypothetical protein